MAPKRDSKKKGKDEAPEGPTTLYVKREPQARREAPDSAEAAEAWKTVRGMYMMPLPVWDDKAVNETEWKPAEVEARYTSAEFSAKTVPKSFAQNVTAWKRAVAATDSNGVEEPEPLAEPIPEVEEEPPAPDPKAKAKADAKSKAKAKAKGKGDESDPGEKRTTAQQFEGIVPEGDMCVVTTQEFRSREFTLTSDDALPPLSQAISAQFAIIGEHKNLFPTGQYLWELIYPQNAEGFPLINPHGKYVVRLFLMGAWRQVTIDDVVPVGGADKAGCASLFPACVSSTVQWPLLLTKALMRAFQADLAKSTMLPVVTALTGWLPYQTPLSFDSLSRTHSTRPFCCVQLQSQIDQDAKQREALAAASTQPEGGRKGGGGAPAPPVPALNLPGQAPVLAPVPKLNAGPNDAVPMQFLVCEVEGDPQQVRLKSAAWRPAGGTPRKTVMKEADSEGDEAEEQHAGPSPEIDSEPEDLDEDDDGGRSQRSPSCGEPGERSARSKEEAEAPEEVPKPEDGAEADAGESWTPPWPGTLPKPPLLTSVMQEHHRDLVGGFWIAYDALQSSSETFLSYMPPTGQILSASLDSTWGEGRKQAYMPTQNRLLTLRLTSNEPDHVGKEDKDGKGPKGPQWIRALFVYEPLKADPSFVASAGKEHPGSTTMSCLLQALDCWQAQPEKAAPSYVHLVAGDAAPRGATAVKSVLLPPGEHSYLVFDDASKAGSVLSVYLDGQSLVPLDSGITFGLPGETLTKKGIPVVSLDKTEYPAQMGFSLWAKAEVTLTDEVADCVDFMQLLSFVSDPTLRPYLQVTLMRLIQEENGTHPESRCAAWSVETLVRAPLLRLMAVPLKKNERGKTTKYVVMLESSVPTPTPGGNFSLDMILPQYKKQSEGEQGDEPEPLSVSMLSAETEQRWNGETAPNDKHMVMCERLTIPVGGGDITAMLRVAVSELPGAFLSVSLVAQLPPREETRHDFRNREESAPTPEPLAPGAPIDPRDYNGRKSWLSRCRTVAEAIGVEVVTLPHVILCEGATYLIYVKLDPYKGMDALEGGKWLLELFGSGEVEGGRDTMEQDLEELVRKSWVVKDEEGQSGEETDVLGEKTSEEMLQLLAAKERADKKPHTNSVISDFLYWHTKAEPVLNVEDPYIVAKDPPIAAAAGNEEATTEEGDAEEEEDGAAMAAARQALGMEGLRSERRGIVENSAERLEAAVKRMEEAKEKNMDALVDLKGLQDERTTFKPEFLEEREKLRDGLAVRYQKQSDLMEHVNNKERVDADAIKEALSSANETGVGVWSPELIEKAELKTELLEALAALRSATEAEQAEPLADEAARVAFGKTLATAEELLAKASSKGLGLSPDLGAEELVAKAAELAKAPAEADVA
mmetsp:Transcript_3114/g.12091  ORF Transcript_3114/g.12091 Transcript_3114/m.12091 type:complete len:1373 (-) Transcript_3114:106-4224(-)